jgi:SAM-dependent methyltransferase
MQDFTLMRKGTLSVDDLYFNDQMIRSLPEFWRRLGQFPDVSRQRALDFGCGHGALSVQLAQRGAVVTGVDLDDVRIQYAINRVARDYPQLADRIRFASSDIADLDEEGQYDLVITKDTLEHVADLDAVLAAIRRLLRPGGRFYVGFSPLYYSPNGAHGRTGHRLPWAHAVLPRARVLAQASCHQGAPVTSLHDIGLNGHTAREFLEAFARAGFSTTGLRFNVGSSPLLRVLTVFRKVPALERFVTVNIYGVLQ